MAGNAEHPRLDALNALLTSAQQLAQALESEPTIRRVVEALSALPPDDRETLTRAIERGVNWRRVNESVSEVAGVRLVVNPNPRLFVRVVDGQDPPVPTSPEPEEVLIAILRVLRRAPIVASDPARAVWEPAADEALGMMSAEERRACLVVGQSAMALIERAIAEHDADPIPDPTT